MQKLVYLSTVLILVGQLTGCNNGGDPGADNNSKDRQAILTHWADNIVKPAYGNFKTAFDDLKLASESFSAEPGQATLTDLRASWVNAYTEWQRVQLFEFGPADKYTLRNFFNIYPTNVTKINDYIADPSISLDLPSAYDAQGFPALDYLINGLAADDDAIIAAFTTDVSAAARRAYMKRLVDRMNELLTNVIAEWNGSYRDTFIDRTSLDIGSSTGNVVNAYVLSYERHIRSGKVGIPAGIFSSGTVQPEKVEAYYKKDISRTLALTANEAAHDFFNGKNVNTGESGPSFASYLDGLGAKDNATGTALSTVINNQFNAINDNINGLSENLIEEVQTNNAAMTDTYASMQRLVRLLKIDMTSAMSISITYTDNDGD